jgi:hypothetical protein
MMPVEEDGVIAFVWEFMVREGKQREFERIFGADGEWAALGRRSRSFLGSSFLQDRAQPRRYLLVDYWSEMVVYERHHADFSAEIARLEERRDSLTEQTLPLGVFSALDVPDRAGPTWSRRDGL